MKLPPITIEERIRFGCGNKVDVLGDCAYIGARGTKRYCSTCRRKIKEGGRG
jgi:hypothetical protein